MSDRYKGAILSPTAPTVTPQSAGGIYTSSQQLQYQGQGVWPSAINYPINNSLRFRASASAYLNRTPASTTNQRTFTWSGWVKRGTLGSAEAQYIFSARSANNDSGWFAFFFNVNDTLGVGGWSLNYRITSQLFRDPSAWYHLVLAVDTTQATASNRIRIYVNGSEVTAFSSTNNPTQNFDYPVNSSAAAHSHGSVIGYSTPYNFDGYLAEVNFIDGTALTPSSFGTTDAYGIWQPIPYTGAYGTNGFYLPFYNSTTLGTSVTASYLMVAGGGAGGAAGGGGGAGGLLTGTTSLSSTANYVVTVGAGGAGGSGVGAQGGNTSFIGLTAIGGGGGAYGTSGISATTGGSGGGGSVNAVTGAAGTSGQGFAGGNGINTDSFAGGGGGGASAAGSNATTVAGGNGGAGTASSISGSSVTYAGGGGGGGYNGSTAGTGGAGGGGNGASSGAGASGTANRGGGGGGGANGGNGGSGGSGVVIVSYAGSQRYVGGTVTTSGGNTIHTFTSSGTLTVLGNDYSGNNNTWTLNNISLTPGSTYDSMIDVPTNTNSNTANYCTLNPLAFFATGASGLDGNLTLSITSSGGNLKPTFGAKTGKFYAEFTINNIGGATGTQFAFSTSSPNTSSVTQLMSAFYYVNGQTYNYSSASYVSYGASYTTGDIIGVAWDCDNLSVTFYKNNVSQGTLSGTAINANAAGEAVAPASGSNGTPSTVSIACNYGQRPFSYTPPTGFLPLNTYNLPTPTILAGNQYMDATTYSGNSSTQSITNSGSMQPDFVWIKSRTDTSWHQLYDSVRGALNALFSNTTNAESAQTNTMTGFASNGFTLGSDLAGGSVNASGKNYVGWQWRASNAAGVSNTQGTITSTVSANTTSGFSIVSYASGAAGQKTVGHGLGVTPSMIITKSRDNNTYNWAVYHSSVIDTTSKFLRLNTTDAIVTYSTIWGAALPTSTVFGITSDGGVPANTNCIAYCFSQVAGYSAFGSYAGNGSTDGPFVYLGFRPRFVMIKISNGGTGNWEIFDTSRNTYNQMDLLLLPSSSAAESNAYGSYYIDAVSNGFKVRGSGAGFNGSGETLIYACFAENPFKIARGR